MPEEPRMNVDKTADELGREPLGIVISRGSREEPRPMFSAYLWEPPPEAGECAGERPAAGGASAGSAYRAA